MSVPKLSNLQFLVLGTLRAGPLTGREIRDRLAEFGFRKTGPAFYQLMSRLEDSAFVEGWYTQEIVQGQIIRERNYRIQPAGATTWEANRDFHIEVIQRFDAPEDTAGA